MAREFTGPYRRRDFLRKTTALAGARHHHLAHARSRLRAGQDRPERREIDYWNMIGVQNKLVRQLSESIVKALRAEDRRQGKPHLEQLRRHHRPEIPYQFPGRREADGVRCFRPLDRAAPPLPAPDERLHREQPRRGGARRRASGLLPLIREQNRGFPDASDIYDLPFALIPQAPILVRRDHFEKAGLDFDKNFPIRDTDHFIEVCKQIQAKAGIQYPTEVYGKIWDFGDTQLNGWIRSLDIDDQRLPQRRLEPSNATTDAWLKGVQFYVDVFQKHKLSSPNTPQSTDEEAVELFIRGQKSIVHCDILNRGTLLEKMPEPMADGTDHVGATFPDHRRQLGLADLPCAGDVRDRQAGGPRRRHQGAGGLGADQGVAPAGEPDRLRQGCRPVRARRPVAAAHGRARPLRRGRHRDDQRKPASGATIRARSTSSTTCSRRTARRCCRARRWPTSSPPTPRK